MSPVESSWNELRRALCVTLPKWLLERLDAQRAVWTQSLLSFASSSASASSSSSGAAAAAASRLSADARALRALPVWASVADEVACLEAAGRYLRLVAALKHALAWRPDEEELRALLALLAFRPSIAAVLRVLRAVLDAHRSQAPTSTSASTSASTFASICVRALAALAHALSEFLCVAFVSALCTGNMFMCVLYWKSFSIWKYCTVFLKS